MTRLCVTIQATKGHAEGAHTIIKVEIFMINTGSLGDIKDG